jgi:hypothetical protein
MKRKISLGPTPAQQDRAMARLMKRQARIKRQARKRIVTSAKFASGGSIHGPAFSAVMDANFKSLNAALKKLDKKSSPLVFRVAKCSPLSWEEVDGNFYMLERRIIALEEKQRKPS